MANAIMLNGGTSIDKVETTINFTESESFDQCDGFTNKYIIPLILSLGLTNYRGAFNVVFKNNTQNSRAGIKVEGIYYGFGYGGTGISNYSLAVWRVGKDKGTYGFGIDVYAGASANVEFEKYPYSD